MKIKKLKIFYLILFGLFFSACENTSNRSSIPSAPVNIRLNLQHYLHLSAPFASEYFTEPNQSIGVFYVGFGGVLISTFIDSNSGNVQYAAYDMACPYEVDRSTRVYPDQTGVYAVCETCGSKFDLSMGLGMLVQGPAKEHLRRFNVSREGFFLRVTPRNY
jgi:nitrite reductase/ring-hydroxylating ferredoxin subunit